MLERAKWSTATNLEGETIVINYDKLLNNGVNENWKKAGQCTSDAGGTITRTKEIIESSSFEIKLQLMTKHRSDGIFHERMR